MHFYRYYDRFCDFSEFSPIQFHFQVIDVWYLIFRFYSNIIDNRSSRILSPLRLIVFSLVCFTDVSIHANRRMFSYLIQLFVYSSFFFTSSLNSKMWHNSSQDCFERFTFFISVSWVSITLKMVKTNVFWIFCNHDAAFCSAFVSVLLVWVHKSLEMSTLFVFSMIHNSLRWTLQCTSYSRKSFFYTIPFFFFLFLFFFS